MRRVRSGPRADAPVERAVAVLPVLEAPAACAAEEAAVIVLDQVPGSHRWTARMIGGELRLLYEIWWERTRSWYVEPENSFVLGERAVAELRKVLR